MWMKASKQLVPPVVFFSKPSLTVCRKSDFMENTTEVTVIFFRISCSVNDIIMIYLFIYFVYLLNLAFGVISVCFHVFELLLVSVCLAPVVLYRYIASASWNSECVGRCILFLLFVLPLILLWQIYLTHWANQLNAPVVSVDYSLAPESPFPRAVNDCFYAYSWVLKNCQQLGTTAKRVILAGDSAGGNFVFGVAFLAAQYKLPVPDLLLAAYPALHIALDPSPGRLQSMTDPLLPFGILKACLNAYRGPSQLVVSMHCAILFNSWFYTSCAADCVLVL